MNEIAKVEPGNELIFEPSHITKETIKKYLCPVASEQELMYGLQVAKTFNLNPLKREIYFVKYGTEPMQILTGYEVYLKRAARSGLYMGMKSWAEGSVEKGDLKGLVEIYVKGWDKPFCHEADYSEYVQKRKDGTINRFWREKPKTMIKKVAISQGFRLAFPDEFDGMPYTRDEVIDVEAQETAKPAQPVEMPKLKETAHAEPAVLVQEAIVDKKPTAPVLSEKSLEKIAKANKFLGKRMEQIFAELGISEITSDEIADKVYSEAYALYHKKSAK